MEEYGSGKGDWKEAPPIGVMGDVYPQFVASGAIIPVLGDLATVKKDDINGESTVTCTVRVDDKQGERRIENVIAVINATGFSSTAPLSILSSTIKESMNFSNCSHAPLHITTTCLTQHPSMPSLGIMGYHGAHWGVFEMQARALARRWLRSPIPSLSEEEQGEAEKIGNYIDELRDAVREKRRWQVPRNPFGDHLGLLEQTGRELGLQRLDLGCTKTSGFVCAARFVDQGSTVAKREAFQSMSNLENVKNRGKEEGLFIARAAFHGLMGEWISANRDAAGQIRTLQWSFHARIPTDPKFGWEYLAVESGGECRDEDARRLVYRYDETLDEISIWSIDARNKLSAKRKLYSLDFSRMEKHGKDIAVASGTRVEVMDKEQQGGEGKEDIEFQFMFTGVSYETFTVKASLSSTLITGKRFVKIGRD